MKSLKKLRGFALHKHDFKEKSGFRHSAQLDELAQATQDMEDMRNCYDSLLSAAAATTNSAYEFSESLRELGACLLEKTALNDDEDSGKVLLMLGKVQFELQKLVDCYRSHIVQTITTPSESLLNELRTVEEMKHQCDAKRSVYEFMMDAQRKGKPKNAKGEHISSHRLQIAHEEYDEEATLFVFRLKSLKQGQSRSLLTQAARHHAAQLNFFKKGFKSLEAVEPHVKLVAEQQHIDYQFSGLEDDDLDDGDDDGDDDGYDDNDDGELSFDYGENDHANDFSTSRNSMELDQVDFAAESTTELAKENLDKNPGYLPVFGRRVRFSSQSAPIFPDKRFDPVENLRNMQPSSRKFHTYVLPTPTDAKNSTPAGGSNNMGHSLRQTSIHLHQHNLSHSSPMGANKPANDSRDDHLSSVLKDSNSNSVSHKIPPPLEGLMFSRSDQYTASDHKKIKRYAFSGPLTTKSWSNKPIISSSGPISLEHPQFSAAMRVPSPQSSASLKITSSPPLMSSPRISELHELPRPPVGSGRPTRPSSLIGHSAPLVSRGQEFSATNKFAVMALQAASPLPTPPGTVPRSFSIPSRGQRVMALNLTKFLDPDKNSDATEVISPPLSPISFTNIQPTPAASESIPHSGNSRSE